MDVMVIEMLVVVVVVVVGGGVVVVVDVTTVGVEGQVPQSAGHAWSTGTPKTVSLHCNFV